MQLRQLLWISGVLALAAFNTARADTPPASDSTKLTPTVTVKTAAPAVAIDLKAAMAPRTLGDAKAPVTVDEYASLSCPHCAAFSNDTFDKFKAQYIDTGKVFYTFHDFPLNAPALEGSLVAHCLPADHYFQFVKFLFQTQATWAFNEHYSASLRQNAKLLGMDDATFDSCTNDEALKSALIDNIQSASTDHKIDATPTFIFNQGRKDEKKVAGDLPLKNLQETLDPLLAAKK